MIIGLILPERLAGATQYLVRSSRREAFNRLCDSRNGNFGIENNMNMIWHHAEGYQLIEFELSLAELQSIHDALCNCWLSQPLGS